MKMSKSKYDLSVIIPTYNRSQLLSYTLESLVTQDVNKDQFEVIICDDGSSDDTKEKIKQFESLLNLKYVFQEDKGYRPASARNNGIRLSEAEICLFIDSGVILNVNAIREHIVFHRKSPVSVAPIGYVYGFDHGMNLEDLLITMVNPKDPETSIRNIAQYESFHDVRESHYAVYDDQIDRLPAPWLYFWTCHLSVKTIELIKIGLFDERYDGRWGVEDNDLGFRLHQNGVKICLLRTATSIHYPHGKDIAGRALEGYHNCVYFHNKFNTVYTRIFLENYANTDGPMTDINAEGSKILQEVAPANSDEGASF